MHGLDNWCNGDITSLEGFIIDTTASSYGLNQLIQEPTHILTKHFLLALT